MANRNRTAGNNYELKIAKELSEYFGLEKIRTTRETSRHLDSLGIDLDPTDLPFYVQCKYMVNTPKYDDIINKEQLPKDKPMVVFYGKTEKKGSRFFLQNEYVILKKDDFLKMISLKEQKNEEDDEIILRLDDIQKHLIVIDNKLKE